MQNVSISFHIQVLFPSVFSLAHSGLPRQVIKPGASKLVECALPGRHWWAHHDFGPGTMVFCGFRMFSARKFCRVFLVHLAIHSKIYIVFLGRTQKVDQTKCRVYEGLLWESIQTSKTTGFSGVNLQSGQTGCACRPTISSSKSSVGDQKGWTKKTANIFQQLPTGLCPRWLTCTTYTIKRLDLHLDLQSLVGLPWSLLASRCVAEVVQIEVLLELKLTFSSVSNSYIIISRNCPPKKIVCFVGPGPL